MNILGKEAETAFRNLRSRYSRDRKKLNSSKVSGTGTDSVTNAKRETSELFPYLEWLEPYIKPRQSTGNLVVTLDYSGEISDATDNADDSDQSSALSGEMQSKITTKSKISGRAKYTKNKRAKEDIDNAELEFLQTIGDRLQKKAAQPQEKDEESIFGELVAAQLRQLPDQERIVAKMEINNVINSRLLRKHPTNHPAYLTGGFPPQEQRGHEIPRTYSQINVREPTPPPPQSSLQVPSFGLTEMQSADNRVSFPSGYFFQQLRQSEK